MAGQYGQASAGGRTQSDICKWPLCSASDGQAWHDAGRTWADFWLALAAEADQKVAADKWPMQTKAQRAAAEAAAAADAAVWDPGFYVSSADIEAMAAAQQTLRDHAGLLADLLKGAGVEVAAPPTEAPTDTRPSTTDKLVDGLVKVAGIVGVVYVAAKLLGGRKS